MKLEQVCSAILFVFLSMAMGTSVQGRTYTYTVTNDCGVDLMNPSNRGGADSTIYVLSHSLWLIGVELPPDLTRADQLQSATLTVNWDCIQQPRDTRIFQYNHPWSDDVTTGSCWDYWKQTYVWPGNNPRQSAGILDEDRLEGTIGQPGGALNDGLIGAVSNYDVTQGVTSWLNGATNRGFGIWGVWNAIHEGALEQNTQTWERRFGFSAESAFPPVFTIEYTPARPDYSSAVGVWCFDEDSGTLACDLSGNKLDGTLTGGAFRTTDHPVELDGADYAGNSAVSFASSASQRVTVPHGSVLDLPTELTIQFWYKDGCGASTDSEYSYIVGKKDAWFIERYRANDTSDIRIRLYLKPEGFSGAWYQYNVIRDFNLPQDGLRHHIAFTYSQSGSTLKAYLDGVQKSSATYSYTLAVSTSDLWIGMIEASQGRRHDCSIDEFAIFNEARSAAQISCSYLETLYSTTSAPTFSPAGSEIVGETTVTISAATGAMVYYTTDGSTPTTGGTGYNTSMTVPVSNGMTLKAIAVIDGTSSWVTAQTYRYPQAVSPIFSPGGRFISGATEITISSETENATIYYTTDGVTIPTTSGTGYSSPTTVTVTDGMTVQAIAVASGYDTSDISGMTFEVPEAYNNPQEIPYGSAAIDGDLSDWSSATWATLCVVSEIGTTQADVLADVPTAYYAAKWQANKLYVAVKVQDMGHYFTDSYIAYNVRDAIEVFVHTDNDGSPDYSSYNTLAQQYEFGFKQNAADLWAYVGASGAYNLSSSVEVAEAAGQVTQDGWLYYEIALTPYTYFGLLESGDMTTTVVSNLVAGQVIGLDVDVICNSSTGTYLGKKSENNLKPKYDNWENIGLHKLVARIPGDANGDGMVDVGDLGILAANYGGSGKTWAQGDFNGDGMVDVGDLGILAANYGTGTSSVNFDADYAKVFGQAVSEVEDESNGTLCSTLGLPLVAGLALLGLMLVKLEE